MLYPHLQGEENPKRGSKKPKVRVCKLCKVRLPSVYPKQSCKDCISQVLGEETPTIISSLRDLIKEEISSSLKSLQPGTSASQGKRSTQNISSSEDEGPRVLDSVDLGSQVSSDEDSEEDNIFHSDDTEPLLKAIRATLELEDPIVERSVEDRVFEGLGGKKKRFFPLHKTVKDLIQREWKNPERKAFFSKSQKRKYPFEEEGTTSWDRAPKLDGAITKISRKASLPIDDAGSLPDPMERKMEACLRRSWEASSSALKPGVASTCVARTLLVWLNQLEEQVKNKAPRESICASLPMLKKAAAFLADASSDTIRLSARAAALSNTTRRALWLKNWKGDVNSKSKLCAIPCEGEFLFGSVLDEILERAGDKGKVFPSTSTNRQYFFRGTDRYSQSRKRRQDTPRGRGGKRTRGFMFNQASGSGFRPRK